MFKNWYLVHVSIVSIQENPSWKLLLYNRLKMMVSTLMNIFSTWKKIINLQASLLANSRAKKR